MCWLGGKATISCQSCALAGLQVETRLHGHGHAELMQAYVLKEAQQALKLSMEVSNLLRPQ